MNREQALEVGIKPETLDKQEFDPTRLVIDEEFGRNRIPEDKVDWRNRAINRLVKMNVSWATEWNTTSKAVTEYIRVRCPYCKEEIRGQFSSGSSHAETIEFRCICSAKINLHVPSVGALSFNPPKKQS